MLQIFFTHKLGGMRALDNSLEIKKTMSAVNFQRLF